MEGTTTQQPEDERALVIHRTLKAPRESVFQAFLDADALRKWFGPNGFETVTHEMDVRPGGTWLFTMHGPDGTDYPNWVRYLDLTPPERIEWDQGDELGKPPWFRTTITFEEVDDGTRVTLRHVFPTREARDHVAKEYGAVEGGNQTLARLAAYLEATRGGGMMTGVGPIIPHLWLDKEAVEAAEFYASVFPDSRVDHVGVLHDTPSGDADFVEFRIAGQPFMALSGGSLFKPNPSISFLVNFDPSRDEDARQHLDETWKRLADGGTVRMELGEYPFSKRYGWVEDRYGVNWQLILTDPAGDPRPFLVPSLMFVGDNAGRAEEAIDLYTSVFPDSGRGQTARYPAGMEPDRQGTLMFADFRLCGQWFAAMDSAHAHEFQFTEGISLLVECETQEQMDHLCDALSAVPEAEQCGWLKDRFGVSWQVTPAALQEMMREGTREQVDRVTQAFMPMKRLDVAALEAAFQG